MKKYSQQPDLRSLSTKLSVALHFSNVAANTDEEPSRRKVWTQRIGLATRSVPRLAGGIIALLASGHVQSLPYGEGMWRKQMMALSLQTGVVGGARDLIRAFSKHPARSSDFANFAMMRLKRDLQEETLALPEEST